MNKNIKSDIGYGKADIFRGSSIDSFSIFKNEDSVYVAKDMNDAIERSNDGESVVLVTNKYKDILRAFPVVDGKLISGMFGNSFIHTSNNNVMDGYNHAISLMDRVEPINY